MNVTKAPPPKALDAIYMCIGKPENQRYNLDRSELLIKTTQYTIDNSLMHNPKFNLFQILPFTTEITKKEAVDLMSGPGWEEPSAP